jgi:glycosyltransferase involved in cell wall biosynthesis
MDTTVDLRLVMLGPSAETRSAAAAVAQACREAGLFKRWPVDYLATHGDLGAVGNAALAARALRDFVALLGRRRRLVLHVHTAFGAGFWRDAAFMAAALAARCPVILQLHGGGMQEFHDRAGPLARALFRFFLERAFCVIAASDAQRAWLAGNARAAHVLCIPSPVADLKVRRDPGGPNMVLFLGRLCARKGIFDLLDAVAALRGDAPALADLRLVCAGEGDRAAVARYAERLGIAEAVKFTGWVGPSGKRALFESAAALALPSYDEALPMSVLEAMSAGVPAVVSSAGALPELVTNGVTGFLVAPGDKASLGRALAKLLLERKLGERMGAAAQESVRRRFAPERAIPQLEALYEAAGLRALAEEKKPVAPPRMKEAA